MPAGSLVPYDATGVTRLDVRLANGTGTPFASATFLGDGREIADVYTLTLSGVSGSTATVTITTASTKGPYHNLVVPSVSFTGVAYQTLPPGISLTTNNTTPANGWTATVSVGVWAGLQTAGNPTGTQISWASGIANPGVGSVAAGQPGFIGKFVIKNVDAEATVNSAATFHPRAKLYDKATPRAFTYIQVVNDTPTEYVNGSNQTQPIKFTFANLDTVANPDEIDVLKDEGSGAAGFNVVRLDDNVTLASTQLLMDGSTRYQISEGGSKVDGVIFVLATTATNSSVENALLFNKRHAWIAPDVSGAPGTWTQTSVTLTQTGQPSGVINPAGSALLWVKLEVNALAPTRQNPFPADISVEYALTGEASWTA